MKLRTTTLPYPLPPRDAVRAGRWMHADGTPLIDRIADWDPATDLHLTRGVHVMLEEILRASQLGDDSTIALVPQMRSDRTGLRIVGEPARLAQGGTDAITVSLDVCGRAIGGTAVLSTSLVWFSGTPAGPLAPRMAGSELWRDEYRCALEGSAARFPVSPVAFSALATLDPDAAWTLDWDQSQLDDQMLGAVRLLINTEHERIRESVVSGSREPGADVVRSLVHFDVARTLITAALADEEFVETADSYPEGSVGRTIADLIRSNWTESPAALSIRMRDLPARFEMELQARFRPVPDTQ